MKITSLPQVYRNAHRWRRIISVLSKYGLADWIAQYKLEMFKGWFTDIDGAALSGFTREARIRMTLSELGPTFIKLGQVLSTCADLVGRELADELSQLQSEAPADPGDVVQRMIEEELGKPLEEIFAEFDTVALASASIGQVHAAKLKSGEQVVVKVLHQGIEETVRDDLDILAGLATLAEGIPELAQLRPQATVAEFSRTMRRELDFHRELRNMQRFATDFAGNACVVIPHGYPELCTRRILTMQRLDGIKFSEAAKLKTAHLDHDEVARRGADIFLEMIFENGFFHADPHPGNLLLLPNNCLGLLDFGMVSQIDPSLQEDLGDLLLAIGRQDADQLTGVLTRIGAIPAELDLGSLSIEVSEYVAYYGGQSPDELQIGQALGEMTDIIRRYRIMLPARVAMLIKTIMLLEGTARQISSRFSLLELMMPYHRRMIWRRLAPGRQFKKAHKIYTELERLAETMPRRISEIMQQVQSGKFDVHLDHRGLQPSVNRLVLGMLTSALFLGSSLLLSRNLPPLLWGISVPGILGCALAFALGLRLVRAINKSGHLDRKD